MTDKAVIEKGAFYVALNPVNQTTAQSIWAAGRVPSDVTKITYRLPGGQVVEAKLNNDGYWMLMFHKSNLGIVPGTVEDWPPIVVTVSRPSGDRRFTITLSEKTICNQVSHGC